jgi:fucose 4-O-acetylase-like acetyltransferase
VVGTRDNRIDVAKGTLIVLVVIGHLLEITSFWDPKSTLLPLTTIYLFHMPAFIFLAGITAKANRLGQRAGTLAVLLIGAQATYFVFSRIIGDARTFSYFPFWLLWFMLAMIYWQLMLPVVLRFRRYALLGSVALSLGAGAVDWIGNDFALSRACVFFPFYVAGALYGRRILDVAGRTPVTVKAGCAALSATAVWCVYSAHLSPWWLFGSLSYHHLGSGIIGGAAVRLVLLLVAALMTFTLASLVPNRAGGAATVGSRSLGIYLVHGLVIMAVTPLMPLLLVHGRRAAFTVCLLLAAVIVAALSVPAVDQNLRRGSAAVVRLATRQPVRSRS